MTIELPHFRMPFGRDPKTGKVACVEQDTPEHVQSCEMTIAMCPQGFRVDRPEFGIPWPDMMNLPIDLDPIEAALQQFEPRGKPDAKQYLDMIMHGQGHVEIDISVEEDSTNG